MRFILGFDCGNAAFDDLPQIEVARILEDAAGKIRDGSTEGSLYDYNGNKVGEYHLETDD